MRKLSVSTYTILLATFLSSCAGCSKLESTDKVTSSDQTSSSKKSKVNKNQEIKLNLYIENSGSMLGYDGPNNDKQFTNVVAKLYNSFEQVDGAATPNINYVNESIQPFDGDFNSLIENNIFNKSQKNKSMSTDFGLIFNKIISKTVENEVSILFSDLIYSGPKNSVSSAKNLLSQVELFTANAFNRDAKNLSLLFIKFNGDFNGGYYTFNSPKKSSHYQGDRPFYMVVVAKNDVMKRFLTDLKFKQVSAFKDYPSFMDLLYFSTKGLKDSPKYSILNGDSKNKGTFTTGGIDTEIHDLNNVQPPSGSTDKLTLSLGISLPLNVFSQSEIDASNFEINSAKDKFKIRKIEPINRKDGLTHRIILEAQTVARGERTVEIKLLRQTPKWVGYTDTEDDTKLDENESFSATTFGFAKLIQGVERAYTPIDNKNYTFILKLNLNENN